jgi:hypothetical protein
MKKKGGLGIATLLIQAHDVVDVVKVILPSASAAKQAQSADDWGELWVCYFIRDTEGNCNSTFLSFR